MRQSLDKKIMSYVVGITILVVVICAAWVSQYMSVKLHTTDIEIGDAHITARVADTDAARLNGLSGTSKLAPGHGMLFVFDQPGGQSMWMKDMHYSLDMIWLDRDKKVVHVEQDLSPSTYPKSYSSPTDALYVLEVPSGFIAANHVHEGTVAIFAR